MQGVNLLGVLVNLLIVPLMPIITLLGMFSLLLMAIVPWQVFLVPEQWLMDLVFFLAEWADQWSFSLVAR